MNHKQFQYQVSGNAHNLFTGIFEDLGIRSLCDSLAGWTTKPLLVGWVVGMGVATESLIGSIYVDFLIGSILLIFAGATAARLGRFASTRSCANFVTILMWFSVIF